MENQYTEVSRERDKEPHHYLVVKKGYDTKNMSGFMLSKTGTWIQSDYPSSKNPSRHVQYFSTLDDAIEKRNISPKHRDIVAFYYWTIRFSTGTGINGFSTDSEEVLVNVD